MATLCPSLCNALLLLTMSMLPSFAFEKEPTEDCKTNASAIHVGMTRAEIESRMKHDGGMMGIFKGERLYFDSTKQTFYMLNIDFRPYGLSDAIFSDPDKFARWVRTTGGQRSPKDEVVKVSAPFFDHFHND